MTAASLALVGCSILGSPYGTGEAPPPGESDAGDDAPEPFDAGGDGGSNGPDGGQGSGNLLANGGFEDGTCGMTVNTAKTSAESSKVARTGQLSCRICNIGAAMNSFGLYQQYAPGVFEQGKYRLEMHARLEDVALGNALGLVQLTVRRHDMGAPRYASKSLPVTTETWTLIDTAIDVGPGEYVGEISAGGYSDTIGPCLYLDDLVFVRE